MSNANKPEPDDLERLQREAKQATEAAEALPVGTPFKDSYVQAQASITALKLECQQRVFCARLEPVDLAVLAAFGLARDGWSFETTGPECAELHSDALPGWRALAAFMRGPFVRRVIVDAAVTRAQRTGSDPDARINEEIGRFEQSVAEDLVDDAELGVAARAFLAAIALEQRLDVIHLAHVEHARTEAARVEAERHDAEAAIAAEESRKREAVAAFFFARRGGTFVLNGRTFAGVSLAAIARGQGARDADGYLAAEPGMFKGPSLAELELVMRKAQASEGVTA